MIPRKSLTADFGRIGGRPIVNLDTVLDEIDEACGKGKPMVEFIHVDPVSYWILPWFNIGLTYNGYGHAVCILNIDGKRMVVNIEGKQEDGRPMVQFRDANEYFFGTDPNKVGEQLGVYNRSMTVLRIYKVPKENVDEIVRFFEELQEDDKKGNRVFNMVLGPFNNFFRNTLGFDGIAERGNCAKWTSEGLRKGGVTDTVSMFPKSILVHMFENYQDSVIGTRDNMDIVHFRRVAHAPQAYGRDAEPIKFVAPFQWIRSSAYWNMERFSRFVVTVPEGTDRAMILPVDNPKEPSQIRNLVNNKLFIGANVLLTGLVLKRQAKNIKNFFIK